MKIKVIITECREIETENPVFEKLDNCWRTATEYPIKKVGPLIDKAVKAIETSTGIPFGDESAAKTIIRVEAMDGETILEW